MGCSHSFLNHYKMWPTLSHAWKSSIIYCETDINFKKYPAINLWSYRSLFCLLSSFSSFLSCHSSNPSLHFAPIFPSVCRKKYFRPELWGLRPSEEGQHWVWISLYIWSCQLTCQMPCRHMRHAVVWCGWQQALGMSICAIRWLSVPLCLSPPSCSFFYRASQHGPHWGYDIRLIRRGISKF